VVKHVDEDLLATKSRIIPQLRDEVLKHSRGNLNFFEYNIGFEKEDSSKNEDSIINTESGNPIGGEYFPGRLLTSHLILNQVSYRLQIRTSMIDKISLIKRIVLLLVILLFFLFIGLLFINRSLTKKIWLPFYKTLKNLSAYRVDRQPKLELGHTSVREFNDLNRAIEELANRDFQAYASQKEFAENASHEMQSPLAVFQSKLELLMQTTPLNEEQASLISDLANASKRMSRLNKSLILLTKIENNQFLEKESISVRDMLNKLMQQYEFQIKQKAISCRFMDNEDIQLDANRTVVEILLGNLLSNAIRHNYYEGKVQIRMNPGELVIQNTGRPFPLNTQKLFQRFQKESRDSSSLGLGLEIVQKICSINHYIVQYTYTDDMHNFSIKF